MKGEPRTAFQQDFEDDYLFAVAFHPSSNQFITGTANGQVCAQTYDNEWSIVENWSTKRHKESCRALAYDQSGEYVFSAGSDCVLKRARAENGKVASKNRDGLESKPSAMIVNEAYVIVGDDDANVSVYDQRTMKRVHYYKNVHEESISCVVDLPHKNKYHLMTGGSTTVAHIDVRKGVITQSEDQEDEVMSGCCASEKLSVFGMSEGVLTVWNNDYLVDQQQRIKFGNGSVDCLIAGEDDNEVYAGGAEGIVKKFDVKASKIDKSTQWVHNEEDDVVMLDFDHQYRLVTASMDRLKLWKLDEEVEPEEEEEEEKEEEEEEEEREGENVEDKEEDESEDEEKEPEPEPEPEPKPDQKRKNVDKLKQKKQKKHKPQGISKFDGL
jgi:WD40 repeat protein